MSIQNDLQELVSKGLISNDQAVNIQGYYQSNKKSPTITLTIIFASIGAILIGLALILILAHNWDEMHRFTKIGLAFLPLIISQLLTGFTILRRSDEQIWKETSAIFLFFSIGISIALIAQIYNIEDSGGRFFLTWTALSIPVIYILRSSVLSLLCILCISFFNLNYAFGNSASYNDLYYYIFLALIIPHYIYLIKSKSNENVTHIHHWVISLSIIISSASLAYLASYSLFLLYASIFTFYYNLSKSHYFDKIPSWANAYRIFSQFGLLIILIILSFDNVWDGINSELDPNKMLFSREFLMTSVYAISALFLYFTYQIFKPSHLIDFFLILIPLAIIFIFMNDIYPEIIINLLTFGLGILVVVRSIRQERLGSLNFGLLIISILILCRFFDTEMSYLLRGLVFAFLGIGFFVTNYFMIKKFNKNEA